MDERVKFLNNSHPIAALTRQMLGRQSKDKGIRKIKIKTLESPLRNAHKYWDATFLKTRPMIQRALRFNCRIVFVDESHFTRTTIQTMAY